MPDLVEDMQVVERQINERLQESVECNELMETEPAAVSAILETEEPKNTNHWDKRNQRGPTENILGDSKESEMNYLALPTRERTLKTYPFHHSDERVDEVITLCTQKFTLLKLMALTDREELGCETLSSHLYTQEDNQQNRKAARLLQESETNVEEIQASRGCRKRFRICRQNRKTSSARRPYRTLLKNKTKKSATSTESCQFLKGMISVILQRTMLILKKLMQIVFLTAARSQEPQSVSNCISDAEGEGFLADPDERHEENRGNLPEEALHTELNVNTAVAKVELAGRKPSQPVSSNVEPSLRQHSNEGPDEELQRSQGHADFGIPTHDCEGSFSTDWERLTASFMSIDEMQSEQKFELPQSERPEITLRESLHMRTSDKQPAVQYFSAHLGSDVDSKIEFKSQLHATDHWREVIGLEAPLAANSQELFSSSTTELDPASSERSGCQKETPYQEELTTEQNPTGPNQSRRANLATQEAGATDNQNVLPVGGGEQNHRWSQPLHAGQPNSVQLPDGRNMSLSRWATMKETQSECRREEKQEKERGIMWASSMETQILGVACEIPFDPGPSRSP